MRNIRKLLYALLTVSLVSLGTAVPSFAWQITMSDVDGNLVEGETYTMSVDFEGEASDYLDNLCFAIEWDTSLLTLGGFVSVAEYDRSPGFPNPDYTLWGPSFVTPILDMDNGKYYDINAETHIDHMGEFFPGATGETHMATLSFTAQETGYFEDLASFYFTPETDLTELVNINGENYSAEAGQLRITEAGTASVISAVPVPAAVWMLGSGLIGVLGLRRRKR